MNRTEMISLDGLVDLDTQYEPSTIDLSGEYWTPDKEGESRRLVFVGIEERTAPDHNDPEKDVSLPSVVFIEPSSEGNHKTIFNASKRLLAVFENNEIDRGQPVQITYNGKKKNRTNANMSDDWSVQLLRKKGAKK